MYNIGSTKVGNKAFVEYYNQQMKGFSYRVQNLMDAAIYFPLSVSIPFPYNLELMIPGIDYVRAGDLYYAYYEHVGEPYTLFGLGNQNLDLGFGGPLNFTIPVPFSHGPDGYKEMLIEAHERQQIFLRIFGDFFNVRFEMYQQAFKNIYEQSTRLENKVDNISQSSDYQHEIHNINESIKKINEILETYSPPPQDASPANELATKNGKEETQDEEDGTGLG